MNTLSFPANWQSCLIACIRKSRFEKERANIRQRPLFQRWLARLSGSLLRDPFKGLSSEDLALRYVQLYNKERAVDLAYIGNGDETVSSRVRYDAGSRLPVLTITYYDGACAYQMRKKFLKDGLYEELGIGYPVSEMGVTGMPRVIPEHLKPYLDGFNNNLQLISEVIRIA